jgi:RNA polymerase subunit RPABC4/transcription elongation factor Spt4
MPAPKMERIRPCLRCGALVPFSALRCGSCGHAVSGSLPADERVRPCLQCGVILQFDQDPCPHCGALARPEPDSERVKPCARCGEIVPFARLHCPACGDLSIPVESDRIPPQIELDEAPTLAASLPALLGGLAIAMGTGMLAIVAVEALR